MPELHDRAHVLQIRGRRTGCEARATRLSRAGMQVGPFFALLGTLRLADLLASVATKPRGVPHRRTRGIKSGAFGIPAAFSCQSVRATARAAEELETDARIPFLGSRK